MLPPLRAGWQQDRQGRGRRRVGEFGLDAYGKSSWSKGMLLVSGVERMERAGWGYAAACLVFGVTSFRSSQAGSGRELCRGVKSLHDVTATACCSMRRSWMWVFWTEKEKLGWFFVQEEPIWCCYDHCSAGEGWLETREGWVLQVSFTLQKPLLLSRVSWHGRGDGGSHPPS